MEPCSMLIVFYWDGDTSLHETYLIFSAGLPTPLFPTIYPSPFNDVQKRHITQRCSANLFLTERKLLLIFIGSDWPRLNVCYHFQGLRLQDGNLFWVSPTVEIRKYLSFFLLICHSNLSAKVMSPCDRSHSHFTQQPVDYGAEVIRKRDGSTTARFFFFPWLSGKKTTKVFLRTEGLSPELPHIPSSWVNIWSLKKWKTNLQFTALLLTTMSSGATASCVRHC